MFLELFKIFAKIGTFTIGGGYAMIPLIEGEVVKKKKWLTEEEFDDIITVAQSSPGLIAVNIAIFVGHRVAGKKGSIVATIASILPPFIVILIVASLFSMASDNPYVIAAFKGIRPVVVALIVVPMIKMAIRSRLRWWGVAITLAALCLISFMGISAIWVLLTGICVSLAATFCKEKKGGRQI